MSDAYLITIFVIAGLVASLDPFVYSVYAALITGAKGKGHARQKQNLIGLTYITSYGLFIVLISIALTGLMSNVSSELFYTIAIAIAVLAILWGLARIKNYFWYKPFGGVPKFLSKILHKRTMKDSSLNSALVLGVVTAYSSVINTIVIIGSFSCLAVLLRPGESFWAIIIAVCLCLPLLFLQWQFSKGLRVSAFIKWKEANKKIMELSLGTLCVFIGWLIFLSLNGSFIIL